MQYGDLGKRIVASLIDSLVVGVIGTMLIYTLVFSGLWVFAAILAPFLSWMYFVLMEGGSMHATVGKRAMGLYVADERGRGITYSIAMLRSIGKLLSGLFLGIGYLMGFFSNEKQCLHDMIAKTYVLSSEPYAMNAGGYASCRNMYGAAEPQQQYPQLIGISGPLAGMVYPIGNSELVIGRDRISCHVVIPAGQARVSRTHCYITYNPMSKMFVLNDRNSTHGTFLMNGTKVPYSQPVALRSGDRFYVATPENTFEVR